VERDRRAGDVRGDECLQAAGSRRAPDAAVHRPPRRRCRGRSGAIPAG
jgi:hypothetical protein